MFRLYAAAALAILASAPSLAANPVARAAGTFERKLEGYEQSAAIRADGAGGFTGEFSTATNRGCGGGVTGRARATSPQVIVFTKVDDPTCRITARYAPDFRSVAISEEGCIAWHGASCEFAGRLKRTGR